MRFSGQKLRELRTARHWDQHRLAEAARKHSTGITQTSVSRHENGMQPTGRNAIAYARALEVDVTSLYELEEAEEEEAEPPMSFGAAMQQMFDRTVDEVVERKLAEAGIR